jgi:small conductance mechanosensitive channel
LLTSADGGVKFGINLAKFFGCLIAGWIIGAIVSKILNKSLSKVGKTSDLLRSFLVKTVRRVALFVALIIGLSYLGVNVGPLMAAIGAAGLVIGLALQGTLSNFASGLLILFYEPFDVGDVVQAGGITGKIQSMTLVNTVFHTADNQVVVVPNSKIWDDVITNVTASPNRRIDLVIGIGYDDDIDKAKTVLTEIIKNHDSVLENPEPQIAVSELGASSVDLVVRPWCLTADYWSVRFELIETIKQRFDKEGINFPFPQQDVHMHAVESAVDEQE